MHLVCYPLPRPAGRATLFVRRPLVIGVGNPYRHDDGVGIAAIERLRDLSLTDVCLVEESGEPVALVQRWDGHDAVVLVDAVDSGGAAEAGALHRFECTGGEWDVVPSASAISSHGLGVAEAVELGRVLDRLPARLVFFGVEAADTSDGVGLSAAVLHGLDGLLDEVVSLLAGSDAVGEAAP